MCLWTDGAEAHRHGAVLGQQSRRLDSAVVPAAGPVRNPSTGTVGYDARKQHDINHHWYFIQVAE